MNITIREPILTKSNSRSIMNQTPFKIYRIDYKSISGSGFALTYYYADVNTKYRFKNNPRGRWYEPPLLHLMYKGMKKYGKLTSVNPDLGRSGLWIINKTIQDCFWKNFGSGNRCTFGRGYSRDWLRGCNGRLTNSKGDFVVSNLKASVYIFDRTKIIGSLSADVAFESSIYEPKLKRRVSKEKKSLRKLAKETTVEQFSEVIARSIPKAFESLSRYTEDLSYALKFR